MSNTFILWSARAFYLLLALALLFFINTSSELDSELYLLGGSCFESAVAVEGKFSLTLRGLLVITSLLIIRVSFTLLRTRSWLYLAIGSALASLFIAINHFWTQKHLFQGYTWSDITDWYDAFMRKCYVFDGPQYGVLLAICIVCACGWRALQSKRTP